MLFTKRSIVLTLCVALICLCVPSNVVARGSVTQHYLTLSAGGGMAQNLSAAKIANANPGADAQVAFSYEIGKRGFFFNFGIGADYLFTRSSIDGFTEQTPRVDKDGRQILYNMVFSDYMEKQHTLLASVPVQFGYRFHRYAYFAVGAKVQMPLITQYSVTTKMYTEGVYPNLIDVVSKNVPSYGYYPEEKYTYSSKYDAPTLYVTPMAEVGGFLRLARGITCRVGLFVEYAIPVVGSHKTDILVDYSDVDLNPQTQNRSNMADNIRFRSMLNAQYNATMTEHAGEKLMKGLAENITFGVRATFRFNVTQSPSICLCVTDN